MLHIDARLLHSTLTQSIINSPCYVFREHVTQLHQRESTNFDWDNGLLLNGFVEMLDTLEEETTLMAMYVDDVTDARKNTAAQKE